MVRGGGLSTAGGGAQPRRLRTLHLNHLCFVGNAAALLRLSKSAVLCALGVKLGPAVANDEQG